MYSAIEAADMALLIVDAGSGVQVGTEKAWDFCKTLKKPTFIMIKRKDKDTYDFNELVSSIQNGRRRLRSRKLSDQTGNAGGA